MPQTILVLVMLGPLLAPATQLAQTDWLPPAVQDAVAEQLLGRLEELELQWTEERMTNAARATVAAIREKLETWTVRQVLDRAPALAHLELPASGNTPLDAMLRYHVCTGVAMIRHERRAVETREPARIAAVAGMAAGSMALLYLRDDYLKAGGEEAQIEKFLTMTALQPALDRLQTNPDDMRTADQECSAVLGEITG